jgi:prevent-host-death family protein
MKTTRTIGVRDAKAQLSYLLHEAEQGREWIVTDRGRQIAKIVPAGKARLTLAERIKRLEQAGVIETAPKRARTIPGPLPLERGLARKLLELDREGRQ